MYPLTETCDSRHVSATVLRVYVKFPFTNSWNFVLCVLHAYSLKQHTFKAISKWRFKQIRLSACLVLMVERIRWKPSSYVSYKDPTLETLSLSILQHLCLWECKARISQSIGIFATFYYVFTCCDLLGAEEEYSIFLLVFFSPRLQRVGHRNYFLESWFSWWI